MMAGIPPDRLYNGAVTRGSAQSSSTGRHNRPLHGALLLHCAYPSGTVAVSERECSRLIGFDCAHGNMSKRDGGDRAKRVSRTTSAPASCIGLLTQYWRQLSVGNCLALAPMSLLTQSKPRKIEVKFMGLIPKFAYHFRLAKPRDFL
jgi:hypothetical protein